MFCHTDRSLAAALLDGTVLTWGNLSDHGLEVPPGLKDVDQIFSTHGAFAALLNEPLQAVPPAAAVYVAAR